MAEVLKKCPTCGGTVAVGRKDCPHCGADLRQWSPLLIGINTIGIIIWLLIGLDVIRAFGAGGLIVWLISAYLFNYLRWKV